MKSILGNEVTVVLSTGEEKEGFVAYAATDGITIKDLETQEDLLCLNLQYDYSNYSITKRELLNLLEDYCIIGFYFGPEFHYLAGKNSYDGAGALCASGN